MNFSKDQNLELFEKVENFLQKLKIIISQLEISNVDVSQLNEEISIFENYLDGKGFHSIKIKLIIIEFII